MSLSSSINTLETHLLTAKDHVTSLEGGTKASAAKGRLSLQKIKQEAQNLRKAITVHVKSLPVKTRKKPEMKSEPVAVAVEAVVEAETKPVVKVKKPRAKKSQPIQE